MQGMYGKRTGRLLFGEDSVCKDDVLMAWIEELAWYGGKDFAWMVFFVCGLAVVLNHMLLMHGLVGFFFVWLGLLMGAVWGL